MPLPPGRQNGSFGKINAHKFVLTLRTTGFITVTVFLKTVKISSKLTKQSEKKGADDEIITEVDFGRRDRYNENSKVYNLFFLARARGIQVSGMYVPPYAGFAQELTAERMNE